jgi:hypothetical protein
MPDFLTRELFPFFELNFYAQKSCTAFAAGSEVELNLSMQQLQLAAGSHTVVSKQQSQDLFSAACL